MAEPAAGPLSSFANLDLDRAARRGYPEAVFCAGKTPGQVAGIAAEIGRRPEVTTLFTRAGDEHAAAILGVLPDAYHDRQDIAHGAVIIHKLLHEKAAQLRTDRPLSRWRTLVHASCVAWD